MKLGSFARKWLERAFEAGVTSPVGGFTTRGVTGQKLTSGQGASDVLALGGTSNAVPTHVSSLVVTQKTTRSILRGNKNAQPLASKNCPSIDKLFSEHCDYAK